MTGETTTTSSSSSPSDDRDTFHVWDGILAAASSSSSSTSDGDADSGKIPLKWEGTVVSYPATPDATKVDVPKRGAFEEFVSSEIKFLVEGEATKEEAEAENGAGGESSSSSAAATVYKATLSPSVEEKKEEKEGDGDEDNQATSKHELLLRTLRWTGNLSDQTVNLIFSRGRDSPSSSPFIAAGWMRVGNRLTIGRRYLSVDDPRAEWSLEELREAVLAEICSSKDGKARIPPWQCAVMGSTVPNKKRKVTEEEAAQ